MDVTDLVGNFFVPDVIHIQRHHLGPRRRTLDDAGPWAGGGLPIELVERLKEQGREQHSRRLGLAHRRCQEPAQLVEEVVEPAVLSVHRDEPVARGVRGFRGGTSLMGLRRRTRRVIEFPRWCRRLAPANGPCTHTPAHGRAVGGGHLLTARAPPARSQRCGVELESSWVGRAH